MTNPTIKLFDTATRAITPLTTNEDGLLRIFSTGKDLGEESRLGDYRGSLIADTVARTARAIGWQLAWVSAISDIPKSTDPGRIDSDRDLWGEIDQRVNRLKQNWKLLGLSQPNVLPRASQHLREQILSIQRLVDKGRAYLAPSAVYLDVVKVAEFGDLSGVTRSTMLDIPDSADEYDKRDFTDIALWKIEAQNPLGFYSPFGWGLPDRNVALSVASQTYVGGQIDLYIGEAQQMFPHHEIELAASQALAGDPYARHWMHVHRVWGDNFASIATLLNRGESPLAMRWALLGGHFGRSLTLNEKSLYDAERNISRITDAKALATRTLREGRAGQDSLRSPLTSLYQEALEALCSNLNTPAALAKLIEVARIISREGATLSAASAQSALEVLDRFDSLLGVIGNSAAPRDQQDESVDSSELQALLTERAAAKAAKNFAYADQIRAKIFSMGLEVRDTIEGEQTVARAAKRTSPQNDPNLNKGSKRRLTKV